MEEKDYTLAAPNFSNRRNVFFHIAKNIALLGNRFLARPHPELDPGILQARQAGNAVFLYTGLHKSLWETSGIIPPLYYAGLPIPYVGMGDNLVRGRLFVALSRRIGALVIKRPSSRKEMLVSARKLRDDLLGLMARGNDVLLFPEGTRKNIPTRQTYGEFFPAAFEALIEYERHKQQICDHNPGLAPLDMYIVPFNVDYSRLREALEMVDEGAAKPSTLHVFDSLSMIRNIGDTYISYGKPIRVADHLDLDRKKLAAQCRERCLELVKILPINVASRAMLQFAPGTSISTAALHDAVSGVVETLHPFADRFRGFQSSDAAAEIVHRATQSQVDFRKLTLENINLYRLYANFIHHYVDPDPTPN